MRSRTITSDSESTVTSPDALSRIGHDGRPDLSKVVSLPRTRRLPSVPWTLIATIVSVFVVMNLIVGALEPALMRIALYDLQQTSAKIILYEDQPRPDVIFMGSSRVLTGLDPSITASDVARLTGRRVRVLNLGVTEATVNINYLILKNIIKDNKKPKVIVYGVSELELGAPASASTTLPYFSLLVRPDDMNWFGGAGIDDKLGFLATTLCPVCRDNLLLRNSLSTAFNPDDPAHSNYAPGPLHVTMSADGYRSPPAGYQTTSTLYDEVRRTYAFELHNFLFNGPLLQRFRSFLSLARERGIKVILVDLPVTGALKSLWHGKNRLERYRAEVRSLSRQSHVPLLDLYDSGNRIIPPSGFFDQVHLNQSGATVLTHLVDRLYLAKLFQTSSNGR